MPEPLRGYVYSAIAARRTAFDTMMWQVPALGLTAQAFLLTIAYGSNTSNTSRYISSALAITVALVAIQTMRKHQANETTDSMLLEEIERVCDVKVKNVHPHAKPLVRARAVGNGMFNMPLVKRKSAQLWVYSLSMFALAATIAFVITAVDSSILRTGNAGTTELRVPHSMRPRIQ